MAKKHSRLRTKKAQKGLGRKARRRITFTTLLIVTVIILCATVIPIDTWLAQRSLLSQTSTELKDIQEENSELRNRYELLQNDSEIENLARDEYNLAYPDEKVFRILP